MKVKTYIKNIETLRFVEGLVKEKKTSVTGDLEERYVNGAYGFQCDIFYIDDGHYGLAARTSEVERMDKWQLLSLEELIEALVNGGKNEETFIKNGVKITVFKTGDVKIEKPLTVIELPKETFDEIITHRAKMMGN